MHGHHHGDRGPAGRSRAESFESDRVGAKLEAEGVLSAPLAREAIASAARLLDGDGVRVRRVLDLGCGPGVGTAALVESFAAATVVAVDGAQAMLRRTAARAARLGHGDRVETRLLDLNGDLAALGGCDLAWAAMSIHHVDDEIATLRRIRALLEPSGVLCILERAQPMSVRLSDELGRPGIWERLEDAGRRRFDARRDRQPGAVNADPYPAMLAAAGLDVVVDRTLVGTVEASAEAGVGELIAGHLRRAPAQLAGYADDRDLAALRAFLDAGPASSDGWWSAASVTSSRKLWIASPARG